jgi:hypothetical protein
MLLRRFAPLARCFPSAASAASALSPGHSNNNHDMLGCGPALPHCRALSIKSRGEALNWYKEELLRLNSAKAKHKQFLAPIVTTKTGRDLLKEPVLNKGTGFKTAERDSMKLRGLVPPRRLRMHLQLKKVMAAIRDERDPLHQNLYLQSVQDRNEVLYYRLLQVRSLLATRCSLLATRWSLLAGRYSLLAAREDS